MDTDIITNGDGERHAVIEPPDPGHIQHDELVAEIRRQVLADLRTIAEKNPARLFTLERTAEYLDTSLPTVRRLLATGELRTVRLSSHLIRVRADDLAALVERYTETGESAGA